MAKLNTTCPGSTRKRRALAAAAFEERMVEEEARKVVEGLKRMGGKLGQTILTTTTPPPGHDSRLQLLRQLPQPACPGGCGMASINTKGAQTTRPRPPVEQGGEPGRLDSHKVPRHTVHHRLEVQVEVDNNQTLTTPP